MKPFEPFRVGRMEYVVPEYLLAEVKAAGRLLRTFDGAAPQLQHALAVASNWRAAHHFPMNTFYMTLKRRATSVDSGAVVAQRIKRLESILIKLKRQPTMVLTQVQDIGKRQLHAALTSG